MKKIIYIILSLLTFFSCTKGNNLAILPNSIYNLTSKWENQNGDTIALSDLKGKVVVLTMIYTSCKTACPRLTAEMREIYKNVNIKNSEDIRYVFVSIDPKNDNPQIMMDYLSNNKFNDIEWLFLRSNEESTKELANTLSVKYKQIDPLEFSHSNIISVLSKQGELVHQKNGLNTDIDPIVMKIKNELKK